MFSNEILKKGVPTNLPLPIELNVSDLIKICKNTTNLKEQIASAGEKFYNLICASCDKATADFFKLKKLEDLEVYIDDKTLEKSLIVSAANIFNRIVDLTGNITICYYGFDAIKELEEELKTISEEEFRAKYPRLYSYYCQEKQQMKLLLPTKANLKKMNRSNAVARIKTLAEVCDCDYETMEKKIKKASANYDYKTFLSDFIHILNRISKMTETLISPSFQPDNAIFLGANIEIDDKDVEKLEMYITYVHQEMLKAMKEDYQQEYLYYISAYYFEHKDLIEQNKKLYSPHYDKIINLKDMYEDYKQLLVSNPKLRIVDFSYDDFSDMDLEQVQEFMSEYFKSLNANWDFFKDSRMDEETVLKIKRYYGNSIERDNQAELEKILTKFIEKKEFFDRTDPYYKILGKNAFDGYIGYIYSNGTVVLEKFFENAITGKVAKNQAIYVMSIPHFNSLTKLSKNEIISQNLCKRFIHKGNWQEKITSEINQTSGINPVDQVNRFFEEGSIHIR